MSSAEEVQWKNIKSVVRTLADWAFGSKDDPKYGSCWLAIVNGITCKDGPDFKLEPLPKQPLNPVAIIKEERLAEIEADPRGASIFKAEIQALVAAYREKNSVVVGEEWHSPGLGEVHNQDHTKMIFCETGDGVIDEGLAIKVCEALNK